MLLEGCKHPSNQLRTYMTPVRLTSNRRSLLWWCPGCKTTHAINLYGAGPTWTWNNSETQPTFSPSVLVRGIRQDMTVEELIDYDHAAEKSSSEELLNNPKFGTRCHVFVREGQIQFLSDCTHELKDTTVPMPPWPYTPEEYNIP